MRAPHPFGFSDGAKRLPLNEQLSKLTRLRLSDVPRLRSFKREVQAGGDEPVTVEEQRQTPQRGADGVYNDAWLSLKQGCLTSSNFSRALGFGGLEGMSMVQRGLDRGWEDWGPPSSRSPGSQWGEKYEVSGLATYLGAYVAHACPEARATETGFWPFKVRHSGVDVELGASPDALLQEANRIWPGGTVVEVKCPFRNGSPTPHAIIQPSLMPQLQGQLMATGAARLHLISWSPYGTTVFNVNHDVPYQQQMGEALALFVQLTAARKRERRAAAGSGVADDARAAPRLDEGSKTLLRDLSERVRARSIDLAKKAECIARIPAADCVAVVQD